MSRIMGRRDGVLPNVDFDGAEGSDVDADEYDDELAGNARVARAVSMARFGAVLAGILALVAVVPATFAAGWGTELAVLVSCFAYGSAALAVIRDNNARVRKDDELYGSDDDEKGGEGERSGGGGTSGPAESAAASPPRSNRSTAASMSSSDSTAEAGNGGGSSSAARTPQKAGFKGMVVPFRVNVRVVQQHQRGGSNDDDEGVCAKEEDKGDGEGNDDGKCKEREEEGSRREGNGGDEGKRRRRQQRQKEEEEERGLSPRENCIHTHTAFVLPDLARNAARDEHVASKLVANELVVAHSDLMRMARGGGGGGGGSGGGGDDKLRWKCNACGKVTEHFVHDFEAEFDYDGGEGGDGGHEVGGGGSVSGWTANVVCVPVCDSESCERALALEATSSAGGSGSSENGDVAAAVSVSSSNVLVVEGARTGGAGDISVALSHATGGDQPPFVIDTSNRSLSGGGCDRNDVEDEDVHSTLDDDELFQEDVRTFDFLGEQCLFAPPAPAPAMIETEDAEEKGADDGDGDGANDDGDADADADGADDDGADEGTGTETETAAADAPAELANEREEDQEAAVNSAPNDAAADVGASEVDNVGVVEKVQTHGNVESSTSDTIPTGGIEGGGKETEDEEEDPTPEKADIAASDAVAADKNIQAEQDKSEKAEELVTEAIKFPVLDAPAAGFKIESGSREEAEVPIAERAENAASDESPPARCAENHEKIEAEEDLAAVEVVVSHSDSAPSDEERTGSEKQNLASGPIKITVSDAKAATCYTGKGGEITTRENVKTDVSVTEDAVTATAAIGSKPKSEKAPEESNITLSTVIVDEDEDGEVAVATAGGEDDGKRDAITENDPRDVAPPASPAINKDEDGAARGAAAAAAADDDDDDKVMTADATEATGAGVDSSIAEKSNAPAPADAAETAGGGKGKDENDDKGDAKAKNHEPKHAVSLFSSTMDASSIEIAQDDLSEKSQGESSSSAIIAHESNSHPVTTEIKLGQAGQSSDEQASKIDVEDTSAKAEAPPLTVEVQHKAPNKDTDQTTPTLKNGTSFEYQRGEEEPAVDVSAPKIEMDPSIFDRYASYVEFPTSEDASTSCREPVRILVKAKVLDASYRTFGFNKEILLPRGLLEKAAKDKALAALIVRREGLELGCYDLINRGRLSCMSCRKGRATGCLISSVRDGVDPTSSMMELRVSCVAICDNAKCTKSKYFSCETIKSGTKKAINSESNPDVAEDVVINKSSASTEHVDNEPNATEKTASADPLQHYQKTIKLMVHVCDSTGKAFIYNGEAQRCNADVARSFDEDRELIRLGMAASFPEATSHGPWICEGCGASCMSINCLVPSAVHSNLFSSSKDADPFVAALFCKPVCENDDCRAAAQGKCDEGLLMVEVGWEVDPKLFDRYPDVDFSTESSREPVPFSVRLDIQDTTGKQSFEYRELVHLPHGLIDKAASDEDVAANVIEEALEAADAKLSELHNRDGPWKCMSCDRYADRFIHQFQGEFASLLPFVSDNCKPACERGSCHWKLSADMDEAFNLVQAAILPAVGESYVVDYDELTVDETVRTKKTTTDDHFEDITIDDDHHHHHGDDNHDADDEKEVDDCCARSQLSNGVKKGVDDTTKKKIEDEAEDKVAVKGKGETVRDERKNETVAATATTSKRRRERRKKAIRLDAQSVVSDMSEGDFDNSIIGVESRYAMSFS